MKPNVVIIIVLFVIIVTLSVFAKPIKKAMTRGYANKNPGNIRLTPDMWKGEIKGTDKSFKTFSSMAYGYRAIFVLLRTYINKSGLDTIEKIINTYAPGNENDTESYIRSVVYTTGIPKNEKLSISDKDKMIKIVAGISLHENGITPDINEIKEGYKLFTT